MRNWLRSVQGKRPALCNFPLLLSNGKQPLVILIYDIQHVQFKKLQIKCQCEILYH